MIIPARFNGPPETGNGGYSSGLVASYLDGPATVTLRRPPPLDVELDVARVDSAVEVTRDGSLIASAVPWLAPDDPPPAVSYLDAQRASRGYRGFAAHPFPSCFVCGPDRDPGDGLRLFAGPVADGTAAVVAAPWVVPPDVSPAMVWAALDCPGGWAVPMEARPYVLGRLAARVLSVPPPGAECVVVGEMRGEDGRKAYSATALYGPAGDVLAHATATWVAIRP
jgi:hypothetical protein